MSAVLRRDIDNTIAGPVHRPSSWASDCCRSKVVRHRRTTALPLASSHPMQRGASIQYECIDPFSIRRTKPRFVRCLPRFGMPRPHSSQRPPARYTERQHPPRCPYHQRPDSWRVSEWLAATLEMWCPARGCGFESRALRSFQMPLRKRRFRAIWFDYHVEPPRLSAQAAARHEADNPQSSMRRSRKHAAILEKWWL